MAMPPQMMVYGGHCSGFGGGVNYPQRSYTRPVIEHRYAEGRPERLPDLAAELVRLQVEVMVMFQFS